MMAQHHGGTAFFAGDPVEVPAPQPRTERAKGPALRDLVHHDGIGVLILDPVGDAHFFKEFRQYGRRETRLTLIEIAGKDIDRQQPAPLQLMQDGKQGVAVFAAGQADKPAGAPFDHAILFDGFARLPHDAFSQLFERGARRRPGKKWMYIVVIVQHVRALVERPGPGKGAW